MTQERFFLILRRAESITDAHADFMVGITEEMYNHLLKKSHDAMTRQEAKDYENLIPKNKRG